MLATRLPDLRSLVEPLIGTPYAQFDCWGLVYHLLREGLGLDLAHDPHLAASVFREVWFLGDSADPQTLLCPWDVLIMARDTGLPVSDHVGLVLDETTFVHAKGGATGVALGRVHRWSHTFIQIVRVRPLVDTWR